MPEQHDPAAMRTPRRRYHRRVARWAAANRRSLELTMLIVVLFLADLFWSAHTQGVSSRHDAQLVQAACDFWHPLTPLPVTIPAGAKRPAKIGVLIIAGAREAYAGQGCGRLPPASPSLVKWAAYYHLKTS